MANYFCKCILKHATGLAITPMNSQFSRWRQKAWYVLWFIRQWTTKRCDNFVKIFTKQIILSSNYLNRIQHTSVSIQAIRADGMPDFWISVIHHNDVIMSAMASLITGIPIVCSIVCSSADQRKPQSSTSRVFVRGIDRWKPSLKSQ